MIELQEHFGRTNIDLSIIIKRYGRWYSIGLQN